MLASRKWDLLSIVISIMKATRSINKLQVPYSHHGWGFLALLIVVIIYVSAWYSLPQHVFWSADEGAKYIQLQTLLTWQGGARYNLPYRGYWLDPAYQFYPQHPIYPQPDGKGGVRFHWPIWFPLISILPYKWFGISGLYLIPLLSGLGVVGLSGWLIRRFIPAAAPWVIIIIGLTSPIFFYSLLFWEHTLVVLLALAALGLTMSLGNGQLRAIWPRLLGIIALLTVAAAMRLEMVAFGVALSLGAALAWYTHHQGDLPPRRYIRGTILWAVAGGILIIAGLYWFTDLTGLAFLGPRAKQIIEVSWFYATNEGFWRQLPLHLREIWINSAESSGPKISGFWAWLGLGGVGLGAMTPMLPEQWRGWWLQGTALLLGGLSGYVLFLPAQYRTLHGLFLLAPYLVFSWAIITYARQVQRFEVTLLTATTLLYLALGTLAVLVRQAGGIANLEWGPRYLLTLYPLGIMSVVISGWQVYQHTRSFWGKWLFLSLAIMLIGLSIGYQARGFQEIKTTKADLLPYAQALDIIDQPIVTDLIWLPAVLGIQFVQDEIYILPQREDLYAWLQMTDGQVDTFIFAGFFLLSDDFLEGAPIRLEVEESRIVGGITFTRLRLAE